MTTVNVIEYFRNEINKFDKSVFEDVANRNNSDDIGDIMAVMVIRNKDLHDYTGEELIDQYCDEFVVMFNERAKQLDVNHNFVWCPSDLIQRL